MGEYEIAISKEDCMSIRGALQRADIMLGKAAPSDDCVKVHLNCLAAEVVGALHGLIGALSERGSFIGRWVPAPREAFKFNGGTLFVDSRQRALVQNALGLAFQAAVVQPEGALTAEASDVRNAIRRMMERL